MEKIVRIRSVEPLDEYTVRLGFTDGSTKKIDLEPYLHGPIFEIIRNDMNVFRSVKVDARAGTIAWDNGADIDPDVLYSGLTSEWMTLKTEGIG